MTHTLHRKGDLDSLKSDYVLLFVPDKTNIQESGEKMKQIWDVFSHHKGDIVNFGNCSTGNSHRFSMEDLREEKTVCINAVFKDRDQLKACLQEIKDRDFGISVVVSGLYEEVLRICKEIDLFPHTVGISLGIHGKTQKLPDKKVLDITTMCGHNMVSHNLVSKMIEEIKTKKRTPKEAAIELSRQCPCGAFNPHRAEELLSRMASNTKAK